MIEFVRVDSAYIEALRKVDGRVQSNSPEQGKDTKPFIGILFKLRENGITYYAPLSSPKAKHITMQNSSDFHKILDSNGELLAVVNFNNMLPVSKTLCSRIDFSIDKDRYLLQKEYRYCSQNEDKLKDKAQKLYSRYYNGLLSEKEKERTCDFRLLENELQKFLMRK